MLGRKATLSQPLHSLLRPLARAPARAFSTIPTATAAHLHAAQHGHGGAHSSEHFIPPSKSEAAAREKFDKIYQQSIEDPLRFWDEAAQNIHWRKKYSKVYSGDHKWFSGGTMNTCYNCLDVHIPKERERESNQYQRAALIYDSPITKVVRAYTYEELLLSVKKFAGVLRDAGVKLGDVVIIYMPMIPEAVIAMLACARIGAIHSVVFGGFAPAQLAARINHAKPKLIVTASGGIEKKQTIEYKPLIDEAINLSEHKPEKVIIYQRPMFPPMKFVRGRDYDWATLIYPATPVEEPEWVDANHPLYILYTSGTTGEPKGVVRENGGHAVALRWSMENIMNINPAEVFFTASDIGWVVGHSYIVYGPLLRGATTVLYEGKPVGTPDPGSFWRMVEQHKVKGLFTAPTAIRAIKREDPNGYFIKKHNTSVLKTLWLAGEHADPETIHWANKHLKVPVVDNWWQTETGWPIAATCMGIGNTQIRPGSAGHAVPGYKLAVMDDEGNLQPPHKMGEIVIKEPLPPGTLTGLFQNEKLAKQTYYEKYPGYYKTGDAGFLDRDDYVWVMSRTDDVINVAGHRLSTGQLEEVVAHNPAVAECAVVGVNDELKGELPMAFVVLKSNVKSEKKDLAHEIVHRVREQIGGVAALKAVVFLDRLPKTRSGKILRGTMKAIVDGKTLTDADIPATIEDTQALDELRAALQSSFFPAHASHSHPHPHPTPSPAAEKPAATA